MNAVTNKKHCRVRHKLNIEQFPINIYYEEHVIEEWDSLCYCIIITLSRFVNFMAKTHHV